MAAAAFSASWGLSTLVGGVGLFRALAFATLAILVYNAFVRGSVFKIQNAELGILFLWFWCLLTFFWSRDSALSGLQVFNTSLTAFLIFAATLRLSIIPGYWRLIGAFYILGCVVASAIVLTNSTAFAIAGQGDERATVGELNANYIAYAIATSVPMALTLLSQHQERWFIKLLAILYIPLAMSAILLSGSRGALIAAAAALLLYAILFLRGHFIRSAALIVLAYFCLYFFYDYLPGPVQDRFDAFTAVFSSDTGQTVDLTGREYVWPLAQQLFYENMLTGIGFGAFPSMNSEGISVHNVLLTMAAETGIPGLFLFCATILVIFGRIIFKSPSPEIRKGGVMLLVTWLPIAMTGVWEASAVAWMAFGWYYGASKHLYTALDHPATGRRSRLAVRW